VTHIPFNRPFTVGREFEYIRQAIENRHLAGNGPFTRRCQAWLSEHLGSPLALLTHSCTAALEMCALLIDIQPGDEVIMPSFTFASTANAFVLRGAVPVFVDVRPDTLNLDESLVEPAITERTRAVVAVHYAGVACEMDAISDLARRNRLLVVEDAAQGVMASYKGRPLGSLGDLAAVSFHETKNVISGEGGAILVNDARRVERAEIIWEKGTNRSQFFRGQVDKYTWVDIGSSYLPSEVTAAFLWAQFECADATTRERLRLWRLYHDAFADLEREGRVRRPIVPPHCHHNAHLYYLLANDLPARTRLLRGLAAQDINAVFHYVPLHSSPAGRKFGRTHEDLPHTQASSDRLVRLPLWVGMTEPDVERVVREVIRAVAVSG
jgi:dTDP-4-amino-4,6-dideoxygalactose transaminase